MTVPPARRPLLVDAAYEVVLAGLLLVAAGARPRGTFALPAVAGPAVLAAVAVVLLVAAVAIAAEARRGPRRGPVVVLAAVNALTAAALVAWALADPGFGTGAAVVAALAGIDLGVLALVQARSLRAPAGLRTG